MTAVEKWEKDGVALHVVDLGVPTKTGKSDRWTHQAVARILKRA